MNPKIISAEDLTLFALQLLTPEESAEIVTHLEHNEAARKEVALIQGDLALYAMTSDLHSPPAMARDRLLRRVVKEKKLLPMARTSAVQPPAAVGTVSFSSDEPVLVQRGNVRGPSRVFSIEDDAPVRRSAPVLAWAGWAVAASLAAYAGVEYHQRQILQDSVSAQTAQVAQLSVRASHADALMAMMTSAGAMQVALHLPPPANGVAEPPRPEGHAAYVADSGALLFVASHLTPLQPYKTYELWVIPADGRDPIPAGTFKPDERGFASVVFPDLPKGVPAKTFGVTIEDDGGSKLPTPPIVLAGM